VNAAGGVDEGIDMSRTAMAFLGIAVLISLGQWLSMHLAGHIDLHTLPPHARRRVQWQLVNSGHIQLGCAALVAAAIGVQLAF
jgi:hypothetical protein